MDYNDLSKRAHETAVKHGFWEKDYSDYHYLMMVITEVAEAVQAHRSNKRVNELVLNIQQENLVSADFIYEKVIKGTVEDEFADIVIRLLDLVGAREVNLVDIEDVCHYMYSFDDDSFTESAFKFIDECLCGSFMRGANYYFQTSFRYMENWAEHLGIDLEKYVNIKMDYNKWRPYKHGKEN